MGFIIIQMNVRLYDYHVFSILEDYSSYECMKSKICEYFSSNSHNKHVIQLDHVLDGTLKAQQ